MARWPSSHRTVSLLGALGCLLLLYLGMMENAGAHLDGAVPLQWLTVAALCSATLQVAMLWNVGSGASACPAFLQKVARLQKSGCQRQSPA
jgi:hypothetical protein